MERLSRKYAGESRGCRTGTAGALFAFLFSLAAMGLPACAVPQDVKERPVESGSEDAYEPVLVNPQPASNGTVSVPAACTSYTFRAALASLPDAADSDYADFEVRWFLDYPATEAPVLIHSDITDVQSFVATPYELFTGTTDQSEPGYRLHVLEMVVSSHGFEGDARLPPHFRKPKPGAKTAQSTWLFKLTGEPNAPFGDSDEAAQCP